MKSTLYFIFSYVPNYNLKYIATNERCTQMSVEDENVHEKYDEGNHFGSVEYHGHVVSSQNAPLQQFGNFASV